MKTIFTTLAILFALITSAQDTLNFNRAEGVNTCEIDTKVIISDLGDEILFEINYDDKVFYEYGTINKNKVYIIEDSDNGVDTIEVFDTAFGKTIIVNYVNKHSLTLFNDKGWIKVDRG